MIVVAEHLIPGDVRTESGSLEGFLVVDGGGAGIGAGAGGDVLAIHDINKPSQFVVLGAVDIIAKRKAEIEWGQAVQGVGGPDGGVEHVSRIKHYR